jgi:uncharacterized coiled-coil protein SlyX
MPLPIPATEDAKWRVLYDQLREAPYGQSFTYDELSTMADVEDIREERWMLLRTREELVRHDRRFLANTRSIGYRVVEPEEHLRAGNDYRKKSMRAAGKSRNALAATDLSRVSDVEVRNRIVGLESRMGHLAQALQHQAERLADTERTTERLRRDRDTHEDRLAAVERHLRELAGQPEEPDKPDEPETKAEGDEPSA